jgi:hypothetical protein
LKTRRPKKTSETSALKRTQCLAHRRTQRQEVQRKDKPRLEERKTEELHYCHFKKTDYERVMDMELFYLIRGVPPCYTAAVLERSMIENMT